jgi:cysteinyl-tRNA synthetase
MGDAKMSKSVGNYVTVRELLRITDAGTLRYFLLSKKYRDALEYSAEALKAAEARLWELRSALAVVRTVRGSDGFPAKSTGPRPAVTLARSSFFAALDDDFDTPKALSVLHTFGGEVAAAVGAGTFGEDDAGAAMEFYREADSILAVLDVRSG